MSLVTFFLLGPSPASSLSCCCSPPCYYIGNPFEVGADYLAGDPLKRHDVAGVPRSSR